jgi:hypothetical protein
MNTSVRIPTLRKRLIMAVLVALLLGGVACQSLENFQRSINNLQATQIAPSLITPAP